MSLVAFAMNGFLAVLLIAALAFGWRLERRLKAEDFERLLEREDRLPPAARPVLGTPSAPRETPRSRARIDDDLFEGPGDGLRPGSNPRAPRR